MNENYRCRRAMKGDCLIDFKRRPFIISVQNELKIQIYCSILGRLIDLLGTATNSIPRRLESLNGTGDDNGLFR